MMLLLDSDDDHSVHKAAYQWADPARGRVTTDPTPHTTSPAYLALDALRAMVRSGFSRPEAERMSTEPAWRAVTRWTLVCDLREAIVLRAHCLTVERLRRLGAWCDATGIRLTLLAHVPEQADEQRLRMRLQDAGLTDVMTLRGTPAIIDAIGPAASGRRYGRPHMIMLIRCPRCPAARWQPSARTAGAARMRPTSPTPTASTAPATPPPAPGWPARWRPSRPQLRSPSPPGRAHGLQPPGDQGFAAWPA
ncbi:hypothetical protein AB0952_17790 [Streptomyces caniferus]|uniref:hypothetical protein n=1 Tax=Streptomyces caniferus TaxID=285557 RepID=UPI0034517848